MKKVCLTQFKSLAEMQKALPTEKKCMAYLEKALWPNGPVSPYAPTSKVYKRKDGTYRCKETGKNFNVKIGTIFENTKLPLKTWFEACYLLKERDVFTAINDYVACYLENSLVLDASY